MNLSSKNKIILVFSDPHQDLNRLETILAKENYDVAVCLGDWFDSFDYNTNEDTIRTCKFLQTWLRKPNCYSTIGNHDMPYLYNNQYTYCHGCYRAKLVNDTLDSDLVPVRDMFKWYIWIDRFLCSHAGINKRHLPPNFKLTKKNLTTWLDKEAADAKIKLISDGRSWMFSAGMARGGSYPVGGITWQDFRSEFKPIKGVKQIVGHTVHPAGVVSKGNNMDIDCFLKQYILILNGKITVKSYADL
jgi:hypothetical protein